jgi:mannose-1-phosphate guanylyltransferase
MSTPPPGPELWALVMAGGRGARFWPLSRRSLPKQCLSLDGGPTLIQQAVTRLSPLVPPERVLVVTGPDMAAAIRAQLPGVPTGNLLIEPRARNTAPCIGWGAVEVARRGGDGAVLAVVPSDHVVADPAGLRDALAAAAAAAARASTVVTLGIQPDRPETGFGYLEVGPVVGVGPERRVMRFTEKPDEDTATAWLAAGQHLWNAGMFVFPVEVMRAAFAEHLPRSAAALDRLAEGTSTLAEIWGELEATSIDYAVMERMAGLLTIPCDVGWSDVGTWHSAAPLMPAAPGGRGRARHITAIDASGCVVHAPRKVVALLGVDDLVVVDTPDALLVMSRHRGQDVRQLIADLESDLPDPPT